jgi:hypothetical protein
MYFQLTNANHKYQLSIKSIFLMTHPILKSVYEVKKKSKKSLIVKY